MNNIKMVDLQTQYKKIKKEVDSAIENVLESSAFINGEDVALLQKELSDYMGAKHVIGCANGTDALQIALMALDLKPGDEVITADFTFAATVEVIALLGLKQVLVDVDKDTMLISAEAIERAITPKTRAIIPVHLFGQCADMEKILNIAQRYGLYVIEDNAQAMGAEYTFSSSEKKKSGTMGHIGTTSFFPSKNLGCYGDGGALFTNDDALAHKIKGIANHGMYKRYYHDEIGVNSRLDSIQAAILRIKLKHLEAYNKARQKAAEAYNEAFKNCAKIKTPKINPNSTHVFHQYTLQLSQDVDRDKMIEFLSTKNIPAMIYYPVALRKQKAYDTGDYNDALFPNTDYLCKSVISLPIHTELDDKQVKYISDAVIEFLS